MKKIAIISELSNKTMNYGNRLQTYALNKYLSSNDFADEVHSLILNFENRKYILVEKLIYELKMLIKRILGFLRIIKSKKVSLSRENETSMFEKRLSNSQRFTRRITTKEIDSLEQMQNENYDTVVVGSDIVWKQERVAVDRMRFLDFELKNPFKKISYAASFGGVLIPKNSKKYIKKYLDDFQAISVREKVSVGLLEGIGVENAVHVCDPTLLLTKEEWSAVAEPVKGIQEKYIFVYLLGKDIEHRNSIEKLASKNSLKVVTIPHANDNYDDVDDNFGDYREMDASPENWIWLIKNAEYVITDSFHATVFSVIFSKKFLVAKRYWIQDINVRMTDFLETIGEQDKFVDISSVESLDDFAWNYEKIFSITEEFIVNSKEYIKKTLTE
ncbi:MAG: polysaccharide pyruvyl transferase family protein [Clostridia bacterium]|nr:polysaccharide pyruvyl transferase family protein [Clostridia bacterium]